MTCRPIESHSDPATDDSIHRPSHVYLHIKQEPATYSDPLLSPVAAILRISGLIDPTPSPYIEYPSRRCSEYRISFSLTY